MVGEKGGGRSKKVHLGGRRSKESRRGKDEKGGCGKWRIEQDAYDGNECVLSG